MSSVVSAHSVVGLTDVCYTSDGSRFITCGPHGDIHLFDTKTGHIGRIRCADQCYCLAVHDYRIFMGTNRNELEVRSFPHGDSLQSLVHFTKPVSALCISNSSLFVGTRDFKVVLINLNDGTNRMIYFDGHQAPILALNVHEEKRWIATSCCDGSVRIFNIDKQTLIKQLNIINQSNDIETASSLVKIDWDKTDHILAIPVKNTIQFYETDEWTREKTYENDSIDHTINLISYSPCRTLFIVAYVNGQLSIINRLTFDICMNYSSKYAVCSIAWNPIETNRFTCSTMADEYVHVDVSEYISKPTLPPSEEMNKYPFLPMISHIYTSCYEKLSENLISVFHWFMIRNGYRVGKGENNDSQFFDYQKNKDEQVYIAYVKKQLIVSCLFYEEGDDFFIKFEHIKLIVNDYIEKQKGFIDLPKLIRKIEKKMHSIESMEQKSTDHSVAIDKHEKSNAQPLTNNKPGFNNQELDYRSPHTLYAVSDVHQNQGHNPSPMSYVVAAPFHQQQRYHYQQSHSEAPTNYAAAYTHQQQGRGEVPIGYATAYTHHQQQDYGTAVTGYPTAYIHHQQQDYGQKSMTITPGVWDEDDQFSIDY